MEVTLARRKKKNRSSESQRTAVSVQTAMSRLQAINDLQDYISQQTSYLTEFDETLVRRWIKQITIWDDRITVELKSGVSIDVDA